jgi:hypothetical protein
MGDYGEYAITALALSIVNDVCTPAAEGHHMDDLYSTCEHPFLYYDSEDGSAYCTECDDHQGEYCERSPDCVCHPFCDVERFETLVRPLDKQYMLLLRDGTHYEVEHPKELIDKDDEDLCVFCGKHVYNRE